VGGLQDITFYHSDYRETAIPYGAKAVIYCDPPYESTTRYDVGQAFNHAAFWNTVRRWSEHHTVLVSEQSAPPDFACIWEGDVVRTNDNASRFTATEKLFKFAG
jgi:DNA adenine methylase